jgi:hypothetical protein
VTLPAEAPHELARAVLALASDRTRVAQLAANARAAAPNYDRQRNALEMLSVLEQLAPSAKQHAAPQAPARAA